MKKTDPSSISLLIIILIIILHFAECRPIKRKEILRENFYLINIALPSRCQWREDRKVKFHNYLTDSICIKENINNAIRNQLFICLEKTKNRDTINIIKSFRNYPKRIFKYMGCIPVYPQPSDVYWYNYNIINFRNYKNENRNFKYTFNYNIKFIDANSFVNDTFNKIFTERRTWKEIDRTNPTKNGVRTVIKEITDSNRFILVKISDFTIIQTPKSIKKDKLLLFPTEFYFAISLKSVRLSYCISVSPIPGPIYRYYAIFPLHPIFEGTQYKTKNLAYFFRSFNDSLPKSYIPFLKLSLYGNYSNSILEPENYPSTKVDCAFLDLTYIKTEKGIHHYGFYSNIYKKDMVVVLDPKCPDKFKVKNYRARNYFNR